MGGMFQFQIASALVSASLLLSACATQAEPGRRVMSTWFCNKKWIYSVVEADKHAEDSGAYAVQLGLQQGHCFGYPVPLSVVVTEVVHEYTDSTGKQAQILGVRPTVDKQNKNKVYPTRYIIVHKKSDQTI